MTWAYTVSEWELLANLLCVIAVSFWAAVAGKVGGQLLGAFLFGPRVVTIRGRVVR